MPPSGHGHERVCELGTFVVEAILLDWEHFTMEDLVLKDILTT